MTSSPPATFPATAYVVAALQEELGQACNRIVYLTAALRQTQEALTALQAQMPTASRAGEAADDFELTEPPGARRD